MKISKDQHKLKFAVISDDTKKEGFNNMDRTTVIGLAAGTICIIGGFTLEGGSIFSLFGLPALIIVLGGTICATAVGVSVSDLKNLPRWIKVAFTAKPYGAVGAYYTLIRFAEKARREGLLSLEEDLDTVPDPFTRRGLQLVIDGTDPEITREILESNISVLEQRHKVGISVFEAAGGYCPTMGIVGTVMGLVMVLGNLSDPDQLAGAIAVAFLATLYGVFFANMFFFPIAAKLKMKDKEEVAAMEMILNGIISIQAGDNPSILREKLKACIGVNAIPEENYEESASGSRQTAVS